MLTEAEEIAKINNMSRYDMCYLWRFNSIGHKYFDRTLPYWKHFKARFDMLGGFNVEISKQLGWQ